MTVDIDLNVPRLRVGAGPHDGSGGLCGMQVIAWENGDSEITDMPDCADPMLARIVQRVNDTICTHRTGDLLCPECSVTVLDLAHRTAGTAHHGLSDDELQRVWVTIAVEHAESVLHIFEADRPDDARPRKMIAAVRGWLDGGPRPNAAAANAAAAAAYAAYAAADAAYAAYAAADAAYANAADAAAAAYANADDAAAAAYANADAAYAVERAHRSIDRFIALTGVDTEAWEPALPTDAALAAMTA